ncbi:MAG: hypothetical protein COA58_07955 [Bacteroidetes bacterium]|nr:MAG: hypothetical protein COA58_07955 [Bacteroidota bacterium]
MKDIEHKIQELVESLDFDKLSNYQREIVLAKYSEEDYRQMRKTYTGYAQIFKEEERYMSPSLESLDALRNRFDINDSEEKPVSYLAQFFAYRLPVYQAVLGVMALLVGFWFIRGVDSSRIEYVEKEVIVYETKRDTLWVETVKEVPVHTVVYVKDKSKDREKLNVVEYQTIENPSFIQKSKVPKVSDISNSFGNTTVQSDEMQQFRVSM